MNKISLTFVAGMMVAAYWTGSNSNRAYTPPAIAESMRDPAADESRNHAIPDVAIRWQAIDKAERESEQRARERKWIARDREPSTTPPADQRFSSLAKTITTNRLDSAPLTRTIEGSSATTTASVNGHNEVATEVERGRNEISKILAEGAVEAVKQGATGGTMPSGAAAGSPRKAAVNGTNKGAAKQPTPPANRNQKGKVQI